MPAETDPTSRTPRTEPLQVDLALQGGGSHGAYTWGVLDRLLEEPWLRIEGISGTSAGAMNAAVLVSGHAAGGAQGARLALERFWHRVANAARFSPFRRGLFDAMLGRWTLDHSPVYLAFDVLARVVSPYDMNPGSINPLRSILADTIDFAALFKLPGAAHVQHFYVEDDEAPAPYIPDITTSFRNLRALRF